MAAIRLGDDQKKDLVERYRKGEATQELAVAFGCSPNTVIRLVKGALGEDLYAEIKRQRGLRVTPGTAPALSAPVPTVPAPPAPAQPDVTGEPGVVAGLDGDAGLPGPLAIDDADDFGDDDSDDIGDGDDGEEEGELEAGGAGALGEQARGGGPSPSVPFRPLESAPLPASLYMLVDKTVELQARPLSDFPELGPLPDGEQQRQALVLFANPRQAKRHCGRTQRVIKLPDSQVIRRTAPYLLGQGITRLVLEGAVYSLPGS